MKTKIIFILTFLIISCSNNLKNIEKPILSESEMIDALVEVHLLESAFEMSLTEEMKSGRYSINDYYEVLFESLPCSRQDFNQSFFIYSSKPEQMEKLLDSVLTRIQMLEFE